jgi:acyl-phosphate glycerol 3-phosphate acyltransferase
MELALNGFQLFIAYILGSIPSAVWIGTRFYGVDVREHGSKNAGATNTLRVLGPKAAIPVFALDFIKGFVAVMLVHFSDFTPGTAQFVNFQLLLGALAVVGHIAPIFAGFRGGKGVATLAGIGVALSPQAALLAIAIFAVVFIASRYVSVGSMTAGISYPIIVHLLEPNAPTPLVIFSNIVAVLLIFTHRKNIKRLFKGEENKISFKKK